MHWTPARRLSRLLVWLATLFVFVLPTVGGRSQVPLQPYEEEELYAWHGAATGNRLPRRAVPDPVPHASPASFPRELVAARVLPGVLGRYDAPFGRGRTYLLCSRLLI